MTIERIVTISCQICGTREVSTENRWHCTGSLMWGTLEWEHVTQEGDSKHRDWDEIHLCPVHHQMILKFITDEMAKYVKPPVTDAP